MCMKRVRMSERLPGSSPFFAAATSVDAYGGGRHACGLAAWGGHPGLCPWLHKAPPQTSSSSTRHVPRHSGHGQRRPHHQHHRPPIAPSIAAQACRPHSGAATWRCHCPGVLSSPAHTNVPFHASVQPGGDKSPPSRYSGKDPFAGTAQSRAPAPTPQPCSQGHHGSTSRSSAPLPAVATHAPHPPTPLTLSSHRFPQATSSSSFPITTLYHLITHHPPISPHGTPLTSSALSGSSCSRYVCSRAS